MQCKQETALTLLAPVVPGQVLRLLGGTPVWPLSPCSCLSDSMVQVFHVLSSVYFNVYLGPATQMMGTKGRAVFMGEQSEQNVCFVSINPYHPFISTLGKYLGNYLP